MVAINNNLSLREERLFRIDCPSSCVSLEKNELSRSFERTPHGEPKLTEEDNRVIRQWPGL